MKSTRKQTEIVAKFISVFLLNIIAFSIAIAFTEIGFLKALLFSLINSVWMTIILFPILDRIKTFLDKKKRHYELTPLKNYIERFEKRQIEIKKEVQIQLFEEQKLLDRYKYEWKLYSLFLKSHNIKYLYHFTDKSNLDSIIKHGGLYSWKYSLINDITIKRPGGDELSHQLDKKAGLENFIRLSYTPNHPMMYYAMKDGRIADPIILKIDAEVIYWKETLYSDSNATSKNSNIGDTFDDLMRVDFKKIKTLDYFDSPVEKMKYFQAEILVNERIPIKYIKNVLEYNEF